MFQTPPAVTCHLSAHRVTVGPASDIRGYVRTELKVGGANVGVLITPIGETTVDLEQPYRMLPTEAIVDSVSCSFVYEPEKCGSQVDMHTDVGMVPVLESIERLNAGTFVTVSGYFVSMFNNWTPQPEKTAVSVSIDGRDQGTVVAPARGSVTLFIPNLAPGKHVVKLTTPSFVEGGPQDEGIHSYCITL